MPKERHLVVTRGHTAMNTSHALLVIPPVDRDGRAVVGVGSILATPLYWDLGAPFLGDRVASYNGFLRFSLRSDGRVPLSPAVAEEFPLVQLVGNDKVVLEYYPRQIEPRGRYRIRYDSCFFCFIASTRGCLAIYLGFAPQHEYMTNIHIIVTDEIYRVGAHTELTLFGCGPTKRWPSREARPPRSLDGRAPMCRPKPALICP